MTPNHISQGAFDGPSEDETRIMRSAPILFPEQHAEWNTINQLFAELVENWTLRREILDGVVTTVREHKVAPVFVDTMLKMALTVSSKIEDDFRLMAEHYSKYCKDWGYIDFDEASDQAPAVFSEIFAQVEAMSAVSTVQPYDHDEVERRLKEKTA